jgi:hypothetical protein
MQEGDEEEEKFIVLSLMIPLVKYRHTYSRMRKMNSCLLQTCFSQTHNDMLVNLLDAN